MYSAWLRSPSGSERSCAAKTLKPGTPLEERQTFLEEMNLMKGIGAHPNVIGIIGHCLEDEPFILLLEVAENGNLRDFLRSNRRTRSTPQSLTLSQMMDFCLQIANGMSYLEQRGLLHRGA